MRALLLSACASLAMHFLTVIDEWFLQFDLGNQAPRSEKLIVSSMVEAVEKNPAFAGLMDEKRYKAVVKRLKGLVRNISR